MSSTDRGPAKCDPKGHSSSFLVFAVSSYLPSSPFLTRPSFTISSSIGYTEPGEGLHHPCVMFSISSMISMPFFGERLRIVRINGLSPRLRKCPNPRNIRYRFSDIGYPISRYKDSLAKLCNPQESPNLGEKSPVSSPNLRPGTSPETLLKFVRDCRHLSGTIPAWITP